MNKNFQITDITTPNKNSIKHLEVEDYLLSIKENRDRIRSSASQLSSITGMLLSASFIIVFFLIKENYTGVPIKIIYGLMFGGIFSLIITMIFIILSTIISKPTSVSNNGEKLNQQIIIFNREYKRLKISQYSFMTSIFSFLIGLIFFVFELN